MREHCDSFEDESYQSVLVSVFLDLFLHPSWIENLMVQSVAKPYIELGLFDFRKDLTIMYAPIFGVVFHNRATLFD